MAALVPKLAEIGTAGQNWENIGWRVEVEFHPLPEPIRPKNHMALLTPLLPKRYAQLQANGNELQSVNMTQRSPTELNSNSYFGLELRLRLMSPHSHRRASGLCRGLI
jgi:hypothetical protein